MSKTVVPPARRWIQEIRGALQQDPRPETITLVARALLLLLQARSTPNFFFIATRAFLEFGETHDLHLIMRAQLANIVAVFSELDDAAVAVIKKDLQKLLDKNAPQNDRSLRAHIVAVLGATCADNKLVARGLESPSDMAFMLTAALMNADAEEDFKIQTAESVSDWKIQEVIGAFYAARGFEVSRSMFGIIARKGEETLVVTCTNFSSELIGTTWVTVEKC